MTDKAFYHLASIYLPANPPSLPTRPPCSLCGGCCGVSDLYALISMLMVSLCGSLCCSSGLECLFFFPSPSSPVNTLPYPSNTSQIHLLCEVFHVSDCPSYIFPQNFVHKAIIDHYMPLQRARLGPLSGEKTIFFFQVCG